MAGPARPISTAAGNNVYRTLYQSVFKSNIAYLTYVFAGAIALEWVYSKGIDTAWEISNSGVSRSDGSSNREQRMEWKHARPCFIFILLKIVLAKSHWIVTRLTRVPTPTRAEAVPPYRLEQVEVPPRRG